MKKKSAPGNAKKTFQNQLVIVEAGTTEELTSKVQPYLQEGYHAESYTHSKDNFFQTHVMLLTRRARK